MPRCRQKVFSEQKSATTHKEDHCAKQRESIRTVNWNTNCTAELQERAAEPTDLTDKKHVLVAMD